MTGEHRSWWSWLCLSSRRRHTRLQGDWSSDVCSSDLIAIRRRMFTSCCNCASGLAPGHSSPQIGRATSELQSPCNLVCRLLLEKKKKKKKINILQERAASESRARIERARRGVVHASAQVCDAVFFCFGSSRVVFFFFFFNDTATTEIYTLSLHDALPIYGITLPDAIWYTGCNGCCVPEITGRTKAATNPAPFNSKIPGETLPIEIVVD